MSMKKILIFSYSLISIGIVALAGLSILLHENQQHLQGKKVQQRQSYLLADELRQSSDDLTRFARTYVVTQDPKYEQMYWDVLAIRNGKKARPQDYHRIYWDFVLNSGDKPRPDTEKISLQRLMQQEGFSKIEFDKLYESQQKSDILVKIETIAMNAVKGLYDNGKGVYDKKAEPDIELAIQLMHDDNYHRYKKEIMQPLDQFFQLLQQRTTADVNYYKNHSEYLISITQILAFSLILVVFSIAFFVTRYILREIGGEPRDIAKIAKQLGQGKLNIRFDPNEKRSGVYAEIYQMQKIFTILLEDTRANLSRLAEGEHQLSYQQEFVGDFATIRTSLENTACKLALATDENAYQNWLKTGQAELNQRLSGEKNIQLLAEDIINFLTPYLDAQVGVFYLYEAPKKNAKADYLPRVRMIASHAYTQRKQHKHSFALGEGLVGQAAYERKLFVVPQTDVGFISIESGVGISEKVSLLLAPFIYENELKGVIELVSFKNFTMEKQAFINQAMPNIAIAVHSSNARDTMQFLLEQSQQQAEELEVNQEELRVINNSLEERGKELEKQRHAVELKNNALEQAQKAIETKASELSQANRYKSEFLANMSHELRTPLNSLLILANLLFQNKQGNLEPEQVEYAETIYNAGQELLQLINDILDLSKVEAGKIELQLETIDIQAMCEDIRRKFIHTAKAKNLDFVIKLDEHFPQYINSDSQRLRQILNNLLSNAFKFTEQGQVSIHISEKERDQQKLLSLEVCDTGVGIPKDKQALIFNAFQQADGTTSRRYGGTGLGLSISKQLAQLMGGDIRLQSQESQGSCFDCLLPAKIGLKSQPIPRSPLKSPDPATLKTHKSNQNKIILLANKQQRIEHLVSLIKNQNFNCIVSNDTESVFGLTKGLHPQGLIFSDCLGASIQDIQKYLSTNNLTAELPIYFLKEQNIRHNSQKIPHLSMLLTYDLSHEKILILTENPDFCQNLQQQVPSLSVKWPQQSLKQTIKQPTSYDRILVDLSDIEVQQYFPTIQKNIQPLPILFYAKDQTKVIDLAYDNYLASYTHNQDQALIHFLSQIHKAHSPVLRHIHDKKNLFKQCKVLIVDDDMRNSYALSAVFESKGMEVFITSNGKEALEKLQKTRDISIILMDIMMPVMDGYETMQAIRAEPQWQHIPIIALTAKAMREDKQKCIDAGANDYLAKPIDSNKLLGMMRIHLYPQTHERPN